MRKKIKKIIDRKYLPRWIVLIIDATIVMSTFIFTYLLRYNLFAQSVKINEMFLQLLTGLPFFILAVLIFKPHHGIIRHSSRHEILVLLKVHLIISTGFFAVSYFGHYYNHILMIPWSIILVHNFLSNSMTVTFRLIVPYVYQNLLAKPHDTINVMIYGAGVMGSIVHSVINKDGNIHYNIVGFVDDNSELWNRRVEGIKVYSPEDAFNKLVKEHKVHQMIFAISASRIELERKREMVDLCLNNHLKVKEVANPHTLLDDKFAIRQFKDLRIEDLLGREPILTKVEAISKGIYGKRVMVSGGAGSIGSEIVRQLVYLKPQSIIIVDQAESAVYDIQNEVIRLLDETELACVVADVTDKIRMKKIFEKYRPQIIFHAAAYKHVPMMEMQPVEAVGNNVGGTKTLADLAVVYRVEKFVMISTDKAVNPTNIMGATKRICELYIQSLSKYPGMKTQFITTRFGNVLGSNGSVIPVFKRQIFNGGPVTVTHRDIIRYFMTIPEACNLVLEACFLGKGGEIYLFDMGSPVRIYDLAVRMISLSGLIPHEEIKIVETGLRPGEKLYEELLVNAEETLPTSNEKIMKAKIRPYNYQLSETRINELLHHLNDMNDWNLAAKMKEIVPEFKSNNSRFESLDTANSEKILELIHSEQVQMSASAV